MSVSTEQVRHIAKLARIAMSDEELERLCPSSTISSAGSSSSARSTPTGRAADRGDRQKLRLREDAITDGDVRDDVLANAPDAQHGFFAVPKVIE
jgi:aspartyl-tRNA(Asn)/glutamyl-tRNA(Gln) amidotransferase subunit C